MRDFDNIKIKIFLPNKDEIVYIGKNMYASPEIGDNSIKVYWLMRSGDKCAMEYFNVPFIITTEYERS